MRRWNPHTTVQRWIAVALLVCTLIGDVWLSVLISAALKGTPDLWRIDLGLFAQIVGLLIMLAMTGLLIYRIAAVFSLTYEMDRNGLYVRWAGNRAIIPLDQVTRVDPGITNLSMPFGVLQSLGSYWGKANSSDPRPVYLFTTLSPAQSLVLHTPDAAFVVSPVGSDEFVQDLEQRRNLGVTKPLASAIENGRWFNYAFWGDSVVCWLIPAALLINVAIFGVLMLRYPALSEQVQLRFDAAGSTTELRPRHQVLVLPLAALGLMLVNMALGVALYPRQILSARLLQAASVLVQILFAIAVISALFR